MEFPKDLRYTKTDEWVRVEGKQATIGITDYAQSQLSDIVFVEVRPAAGEALAKGDAFAAVESVKAASDVYTPAGGKVVQANEALSEKPETINSDPYGAAWMLRLELAQPDELAELMDAAAYEAYCQERSH
jgi:glycine cleavage system H protein